MLDAKRVTHAQVAVQVHSRRDEVPRHLPASSVSASPSRIRRKCEYADLVMLYSPRSKTVVPKWPHFAIAASTCAVDASINDR